MSQNDKLLPILQEKAARFEQQLEDLFIDPDGLVYNCIHNKYRRPYKAEDFSPTDSYRQIWRDQGWPTIEAFTNWIVPLLSVGEE